MRFGSHHGHDAPEFGPRSRENKAPGSLTMPKLDVRDLILASRVLVSGVNALLCSNIVNFHESPPHSPSTAGGMHLAVSGTRQ